MSLLTDPPSRGWPLLSWSEYYTFILGLSRTAMGPKRREWGHSVLPALRFALAPEGAFLLGNYHVRSLTLHLICRGASWCGVSTLPCEHILPGCKVLPSAFSPLVSIGC